MSESSKNALVFVCYSKADYSDFVMELVTTLSGLNGLDVPIHCTDFTLKWGDSVLLANDKEVQAAEKCTHAIIVITKRFLTEKMEDNTFKRLLERHTNGELLVLPIWHNVTAEEICAVSPVIADIVGLKSEHGIEAILIALNKLL